MSKKTKNNFKKRLFRAFKKTEKDLHRYDFKEILSRDVYVLDAYKDEPDAGHEVFLFEDFNRAKGINRFYLMRYSYAEHIYNIANIKKDDFGATYNKIFYVLEKRKQNIITFKQAKKLLFPLSLQYPIEIGLWLKLYRKFYNKYVKIKKKINEMIEA